MKNKANSRFMKATVATAVVASTFAAQAPLSTEASTSFPDVKASNYFYDAIQSLSEREIINGYPDGKFHPQDQVTRGQAAKIIAGVLGLDIKNTSNPNFIDVKTNHPFYGVIAALAEKGIIVGTGNGTFKPNEPIQRNHLAKIIAEAFELKAANTDFPFKDVPKEYQNYVASLYENGITTGKTSTLFDGKASTTRGEFAVFIHRAENVLSQPDENTSTPVNFTVESVANNKIQTSSGSYTIDAPLHTFFATNASALKGSEVKAVVQNGKVVKINDLTVNIAGTASTPAVIDGSNMSIAGDVQVNADYVAVKNLKVDGDITLTAKVINSYASDNVDAKGDLIIAEAGPIAVASLNGIVANIDKGPKVELRSSSLKSVHTKRNNVDISSNTTIPEIIVTANVTSIIINANISQVTVNVNLNVEIKGTGNIEKLSVDQAKEIALNISGKINQLSVLKADSKVEVGAGLQIAKLVVPVGINAAQVIRNFEAVKGKIESVVDNKGNANANNNGNNSSNNGSNSGNNGSNNGNDGGITQPQPKNFTLSIMHTNDSHANVDKYPKLVTAAKEVKKEKPNSVLVHAGDVFSGTLYFNEFQGQADLEFMNLMGYDVMTFGNHEFDLGSNADGHKALADFIKGAKFPFVSSNIDFSNDDNLQGLFSDLNSSSPEDGKIYNGIVKEIDGQKVGFFGLTTAETADISSPGKVKFQDYIEEAEKAVKAFEGMGVNKIVAVTHIGYDDNAAVDNDLELAKAVDGIDVIIGGHSHTQLDKPKVVDEDGTPTVIAQAYQYNDFLGTLDVEFDSKGNVVKNEGKLIKVADKTEDAEAVAKLTQYKTQVDKTAKTEIGVTAEQPLLNPRTSADNPDDKSVRKNETILGNLITDGMLAKANAVTDGKVIMALQNGGGIRAAIEAGPITVGEVITVLPFGNTLATMNLTGAEIKQAFETSFKSYPTESGGFLHVSGAKVEFDSTKPAGQRVVSVKYKDADGNYVELENTQSYTIATNAFTAKGGDGYDVFAKAYGEGRVTDLGLSDWENFAEHLKTLTTIPTEIEGRILDVAGKGEEEDEEEKINKDPGTTPAATSPAEIKPYNSNPEKLTVSQIARYDSGKGSTGTEIMAYDSERKLGFVTNGAVGGFDIMSFADLKTGVYTVIESTKRVVLADYGIAGVKNITSIASHPTEDLIAIAAYGEKTERGYIVFATKGGKYVKHVQVGYLPDSLEFTPDGSKLVVANEGEPSIDTQIDPEGSISVINIADYSVKDLKFTKHMLDDNVRMSYQGKGSSYLQQLEPEYVTITDDSTMAYVSLQENNAIATVDLTTDTITGVKGLGVLDHSVEGFEMDANKDDKAANIVKAPILTFHMPDAIDTFTINGKKYIITPNEGDSRDYEETGGYSEVVDLEDLENVSLQAEHYKGYTQDELNAFDKKTIKGYKVTKENGKNAEGSYEAIYGFGGRSFSIFEAATMEQKFDSGSQFETIIKEKTPNYFNTNNDEIKLDNRSDDKGPEPESAVVGVVEGTTYAFIGLERHGAIMVYDLSNPENPEFVTMLSSRDFSQGVAGDVSPEGLKFVAAEESPTGKALLIATHEVSGTIAVYELGEGNGETPTVKVPANEFSGSEQEPKIYEGNVEVDITDIEKLENAVVDGNLILVGTLTGKLTFSNVTVKGNADFKDLGGDTTTIDGLTVEGDTEL